MLVYVIIGLFAVAFSTATYLNFDEIAKSRPWFNWAYFGLCNFFTFCWLWLMQEVGKNHNKLYFASIVWDVVAVLIGLFVPLLFCKVELTEWAWIGLFLTFVGLLILKTSMLS